MHRDPAIDTFLTTLSEQDGHAPLSDAKLAALGEPDTSVVIAEQDRVVAVAACARHRQTNGTVRFAIETAVEPSMRFHEFEAVVLDSAMALVPDRSALSIWSNRPSLDRAVESMGWIEARSLLFMAVDRPTSGSRDDELLQRLRTFTEADIAGLVAANRRAFADHREAASLGEDDVARMMKEPWFDPEGIFLLSDPERIIGFCWTRIHDNGDGEIYRIGVVPDHSGTGAGRVLLLAGLAHLTGKDSVQRCVLWVDGSNERAISLYRSVGMQTERTIREFEQR